MTYKTRTLDELNGDNSFVSLEGNNFVIPAGNYNVSNNSPVRIQGDCNETYNTITVTQLSKHRYAIPVHNFWRKLKYLFTGKLEGVVVIIEKVGSNE
jgi:hypothetical protein